MTKLLGWLRYCFFATFLALHSIMATRKNDKFSVRPREKTNEAKNLKMVYCIILMLITNDIDFFRLLKPFKSCYGFTIKIINLSGSTFKC